MICLGLLGVVIFVIWIVGFVCMKKEGERWKDVKREVYEYRGWSDIFTRTFLNYTWQSDDIKEQKIVAKHIRKKHKMKGQGYDGNASGRGYLYCKECPVVEVREWCWDGSTSKDFYIRDKKGKLNETYLIRMDYK